MDGIRIRRSRRHSTNGLVGPVRAVRPGLVFEIEFDGVLPSTRHKSGVTLRDPRVLRPRPDKPAPAADTLDSLRAHLP